MNSESNRHSFAGLRIAVILPCYNEATTIASVVQSFRAALPEAKIYAFDNNSSDNTSAAAHAAGAIVRHEHRQGKGHVVRRAFADVEADVYVLADGDGTYDASKAPDLVARLVRKRLDMVVAARTPTEVAAYRPLHMFGNRMFNRLAWMFFGSRLKDIFSGYRVFSRRFAKSFPKSSAGFEIETDLTIHALELRLPIEEVALPYGARPDGSKSKLNTLRDGGKILFRFLVLLKEVHPFSFFSVVALVLALLSLAVGSPVVTEYLKTGLVPRLPTAVLATGIMLLAGISLCSGMILDSVSRSRREIKQLFYLAQPPLRGD
jgi:glycosyltransferase involved in cell wall biosynthesis